MFIDQLLTASLSQFSYYIESNGEAAIVDPMREIAQYIDLAKKRGASIKYIFETHFHSDFVSGHLDLAKQTGAKIIFGPNAVAEYEMYTATDNEVFNLGAINLKVLHTPGHTPESCCILLLDERQIPHSVFTGDTLFVSDVGRPDLATGSAYTKEQMAGVLYDSIQTRLLSLPNYVVVYPGHGAGSACGKTIGKELHSTIGVQKSTNYALKTGSKPEFIKAVTEGLPVPPPYFYIDAEINRKGYSSLTEVMNNKVKALSVENVQAVLQNKETVIIDTRSENEFAEAMIPGSVFIGLDGAFETTAGNILDINIPLILVTAPGRENEAVLRLARIGFENVEGYLSGGVEAWKSSGLEMGEVKQYSAEEFAERFRYNSCNVIDVRNPDEWIPGFVSGAKLIALPDLLKNISKLDPEKMCFVYCLKGYRSMVACSILLKHHFANVVNVSGGMVNIRKTAISVRQLSSLPT